MSEKKFNPKTLADKSGIQTQSLVYCGMFTVLIAVGAFIKIPIPVVPFTLQFLFTTMAGLLLGSRLGAASVGIYTLLGLIGLPIFSEGGGIWYVMKPSFGYILGFIAGTFVTGRIIETPKTLTIPRYLLANFSGLAIVYAMGMIYYYLISNYVINSPIGFETLFLYCFILAVPGDIFICIVTALLTKQLRPVPRNLMH